MTNYFGLSMFKYKRVLKDSVQKTNLTTSDQRFENVNRKKMLLPSEHNLAIELSLDKFFSLFFF